MFPGHVIQRSGGSHTVSSDHSAPLAFLLSLSLALQVRATRARKPTCTDGATVRRPPKPDPHTIPTRRAFLILFLQKAWRGHAFANLFLVPLGSRARSRVCTRRTHTCTDRAVHMRPPDHPHPNALHAHADI